MNTKANTLRYLQHQLSSSHVLPMLVFTWQQWQTQRENCLEDQLTTFVSEFTPKQLVIRSSCVKEDRAESSFAGHFLSLLGVAPTRQIVSSAIDQVFASYGQLCDRDQVLIQPQLNKVNIAGVIFTHDPSSGAPYYIINYDNTSSRTDSVTSGDDQSTSTQIIAHHCNIPSSWQFQLITSIKEIQQLTGIEHLDVEFAFDKDENLFIFQARRLCLNHTLAGKFRSKFDLELNCIYKKVHRLAQPHPYLLGNKTLFGIMPDWNPAEIIGTRPKPLAASLYKTLVTDGIWAQQRYNYGYRDVRDFPLVITLGGIPYIDVRASLNSFIPASLEDSLAEKLVNYYLNKLEQYPHFHDKIEFDIAYTCYTFDLDVRLKELHKAGFTIKETRILSDALKNLTFNLIKPQSTVFLNDRTRVTQLANRQKQIAASSLNQVETIYWTIQDCKAYGTLPFAGLARCGFVAVQLLNSLVSTHYLTVDQREAFLNGISTVSSQMVSDFQTLDKNAFLDVYGHLRPGTYDITSPRYDESPDNYFRWTNRGKEIPKLQEFYLEAEQAYQIDTLLLQHELALSAEDLFNFIRQAIEQREMAKFLFTKSLSDCMKTISELGARFGHTREQLSYTTIADYIELYSTTASAKATLKNAIRFGEKAYQYASAIQLPPLISDQQQVLNFELPNDQPNFITHNRASACTEHITNTLKTDLREKIVFIDAADPGYDWIFSQNIAGLITKYGGCNSHMAIRAAELNLPAVIGAGEKLFSQWKKYRKLQLDCANKTVLQLQ
ncbi:pyruvate phosphate dikinase-like enzyme [Alteromonadaceae bacterium 2753L.S.0a.02]|nr:pyruvate phosphate dikinase-like enzyme [Alteromonadaceae bacterium 2753L.S.0a.02]